MTKNKFIRAAVAAFLCLAVCVSAVFSGVASYVIGDINGDENISYEDFEAVRLAVLNGDETATYDIDRDSDVDICDMVALHIAATEFVTAQKFAVKFENTADYIYRVGNANEVKLGWIFEEIADYGFNDKTVKVTVEKLDEDTNLNWTLTDTAVYWENFTLKFSGTGTVKVTISDICQPTSLVLEVVNAANVTSYSELGNRTSVLLSDIDMTANGSFYLSGATLYGNGFVFDVSEGAYNGTGSISNNYLVSLNNAHLDNVKIVGAVYTAYGAMVSNDYNRPTVLSSGTCTITNSYISNCASPVRVNGGDLNIVNSTLKGGNFANLDIRNGNITLSDVTTINQVKGNDTTSDGTVVVGLGVVVYYENVLDTTTVEVKGSLTQYNCLSESDVENYIKDTNAKMLVTAMFGNDYSALQFADANGVKWINTGILSMTAEVGDENISDVTGYSEAVPTFSGVSGYVHTSVPTADSIETTAPQYAGATQGAIAPTYSFDHTNKNYIAKTEGSNRYCYEDGGVVLVSFDDGDTLSWDTSILTVSKDGRPLDYTVSIDGIDYTGSSVVFSESGDYTAVYTYTDPYNYRVDENGDVVAYSATYSKEVKITVSVVKATAKNAEFTFNGTSSKKITIGNNTYVMPDVSATSSTVGSTTVSGTTVYYPIVEMIMSDGKTSHSGTGWQAYFPVFKGAVTITDYADGGTGAEVEYGDSTTSLPSGLAVVGDPSTLFKYQSSSSAGTDPQVKNNILVYVSPTISAKRDEYNTLVQYTYKDNAGITYYYYVGYHAPAQTYSSTCFTPDTLITLADGSRKRIDALTFDDKLLAWDFFKGEYTEKNISILVDHGKANYKVVNLEFSGGTVLRLIGDHGVFEYDLNEYVYISADNIKEYIGHRFVKQGLNGGYDVMTLTGGYITEEYTSAWSVSSATTFNAFASGMLTVAPPDIFYNWIEMDGKLHYDVEQFEKDVETYGLYSYETFADYVTYEQFVAFRGAYLKIPVEKGIFSFEYILGLIEVYGKWMPQ